MTLVLSLNEGRAVVIGDIVTVTFLSKVGIDSLLEFVTPTLKFRALLVLQSTIQIGLVTFKVIRGGVDRGRQIGIAIDAPRDVVISRPEATGPPAPPGELQAVA